MQCERIRMCKKGRVKKEEYLCEAKYKWEGVVLGRMRLEEEGDD